MRWSGQELNSEQQAALPGLVKLSTLVRTVQTPEFAGITFHEILAKSALNHIPGPMKSLPYGWTINPYRGCSHACVYCFARRTHEYLEFDAGQDFDSQIVVKVNIAEVLAKELAKPSWQKQPVALGTNTDPYQRAEGRYRLMPGIIAALAGSGTPFSILTKGTLLRRDLPLLAEASELVPVDLAMSIAIYDDELQQSIEPGTPSTAARLATVRAARDLGLYCSVFMMPIIPYLTDTRAHLDSALEQIKASGASSVLYSALHLRTGAKEWFMGWLAENHPQLVPRYDELYGAGAYAPKEYRRWLAAKMAPLVRRHGLDLAREDAVTGGIKSGAIRSSAIGRGKAGQAGLGQAGLGQAGQGQAGLEQTRLEQTMPGTIGRRSRPAVSMTDADGAPSLVWQELAASASQLGPQPTLF